MAHFAQLDNTNVVTQVIVVSNNDCLDAHGQEREEIGIAFCQRLFGGNWKQTSYNHSMRKRYAGIGYSYNAQLDAFVSPKPFASWTLDNATAAWVAPTAMPTDDKMYHWDEATLAWVENEVQPA